MMLCVQHEATLCFGGLCDHILNIDGAQDLENRKTLLMDPHARAIKHSHVLNIHGTKDETVRILILRIATCRS